MRVIRRNTFTCFIDLEDGYSVCRINDNSKLMELLASISGIKENINYNITELVVMNDNLIEAIITDSRASAANSYRPIANYEIPDTSNMEVMKDPDIVLTGSTVELSWCDWDGHEHRVVILYKKGSKWLSQILREDHTTDNAIFWDTEN